jgi:uncharacterized membrane protein YidH (DUF202 family)
MHPDLGPFPGVAAERTALSWQRSSLSMISVGALVVRWSMVEHLPTWPGIVLTAVVAVGSLVAVSRRYHRVLDSVRAGRTPRSRYLIPTTAALAVIVVVGVAVGIAAEYTAF